MSERLCFDTVFKVNADPDGELAAIRPIVDEYLSAFDCPPFEDGKLTDKCPSCGSHLYFAEMGPFSMWQWGLAHGEGYCGKCKRHGRMYHRVKLSDEEDDELTFAFPLLYPLAGEVPA